jgi:hypothetical protein
MNFSIARTVVAHPLVATCALQMDASRGTLALAPRITVGEWTHTVIHPSPYDLGRRNQGTERITTSETRAFQALGRIEQARIKLAIADKLIKEGVKLPQTGPIRVDLLTSEGPVSVKAFLGKLSRRENDPSANGSPFNMSFEWRSPADKWHTFSLTQPI